MNLLIDLDGVLRFGNKTADFLDEFFQFIQNENVKAVILSNSTLSNADSIYEFFRENNKPIKIPVMTAADAAFQFSKENYSSVRTFCNDTIKKMFAEIENELNPDAIVIGDIGDAWNFGIMNQIFLHVKNGADLIAMQTNRFWNDPDKGLLLDVGPFVKAIEYATETEAKLIGKPSPLYFEAALNLIGSEKNDEFYMIGDDLETDIGGAQLSGGKGILIYTGKTNYPLSATNKIKPDYEVFNLREAVQLLQTLI